MVFASKAAEDREVMALVCSEGELDQTLADLKSHDFRRADISLVAEPETCRHVPSAENVKVCSPGTREADTRLGEISQQRLAPGFALLVGLITFFCAGAGAAIAAPSGSIGAMVLAAIVGSGLGAGCGAVVVYFIRGGHLRQLRGKLEKGQSVVGVRTDGAVREMEATDVLETHTRETLHVRKLENNRMVAKRAG